LIASAAFWRVFRLALTQPFTKTLDDIRVAFKTTKTTDADKAVKMDPNFQSIGVLSDNRDRQGAGCRSRVFRAPRIF
jgi:hypothetical protein